MICKQCGAKIDDNAVVCEFCGEVYGEVEKVEEMEPVVEAPVLNAEDEAVKTEEIAVPETEEEIEEMMDENEAMKQAQMDRIRTEKQIRLEEIERRRLDKKRRQRRNKILIAILAILCVGAVGLGAYYMTSNGDGDDDVVIVTPRPTVASTEAPAVTPEATEEPTDEPTVAPTVAPATAKPEATAKPVTNTKPRQTAKPVVSKPVATAKPVVNKATDFNSVKAKFGGAQIFANSSTTALTDADVKNLTKSELRVARNEIYARHGRGFSNSALQAYFNGCSWYKMDANYDYANEYSKLTDVEKANIKLIKAYEAK